MDLQEIYKEESGYDVGRYNIDNTNYYSEDYVEWLEKNLRIGSVERRSEQLICEYCNYDAKPTCCDSCLESMVNAVQKAN